MWNGFLQKILNVELGIQWIYELVKCKVAIIYL